MSETTKCIHCSDNSLCKYHRAQPYGDGLEYDESITRFEVISDAGRLIVRYDVEVSLSFQDDGRTLKVFMRDRAVEAPIVDENCPCGHLLVIHGIITGKCLGCECIINAEGRAI